MRDRSERVAECRVMLALWRLRSAAWSAAGWAIFVPLACWLGNSIWEVMEAMSCLTEKQC